MNKVEQKPYKLFLNMIVGDFEPLDMLKRAIDSVNDYVDGAYITVTYKDKEPITSPLVRYLKSKGYHVSYFKWIGDFSAARNFAMNQVPKSPNHYLLWIDVDDVLLKGENISLVMKDMHDLHQASIFFNYLYLVEFDKDGSIREVLVEHKRERIVRHDDTFKWIGMLHEVLIEQRQENITKYFRPECTILHMSTETRSDVNIHRNVKILEAAVAKEERKDPRTIIYLAKAYFDLAKDEKQTKEQRKIYTDLALMLFKEYLEGDGDPGDARYREGSGWKEERSTAWEYVSELFRWHNKFDQALEAINKAIDEAPQFPMYYIDKAVIYVSQKDIAKAKHWLKIATTIPEPDTTIITTPRDLKAKALEVDYHISLTEMNLPKTKQDLQLLLEIFPDQPDYLSRLKTVEEMETSNKAAQSIIFLGKYLEDRKENMKLPFLVKSIPEDLQLEKFASEMKHKFLPEKVWKDNEITILCGPGWEEWTPKNIETGLGGSEEAVVHMSKELTKLGYKVTVYANPMGGAGIYDGVEYKQWYDLNVKDNFNILILWRSIGFVDVNPKSKFTLLWLHDVPNNTEFTEDRMKKINKIAVLSEYHKSLLKMQLKDGSFDSIPENKILLTRNGISLVEPIPDWKGDPHKCIYASSLDRGLVYLLKNWKKVRDEVPDATLDIYYGFNIFDKIFANNPGRQEWKGKVLEMMKQPGITYHGRVGHKALEEAYAKSGIWVYPTDFTEISCIVAMKAQALGAVPVVTNFSALKETVRNGAKVDKNIASDEGQEEYVKALVNMLKDEEQQKDIRLSMIPWAREFFPWSKVSEDWNNLFKSTITINIKEASK